MKKEGIRREGLPCGSYKLEREESYYSHNFALTSRLLTYKVVIDIRDKNIDFVQVLHRKYHTKARPSPAALWLFTIYRLTISGKARVRKTRACWQGSSP